MRVNTYGYRQIRKYLLYNTILQSFSKPHEKSTWNYTDGGFEAQYLESDKVPLFQTSLGEHTMDKI